MQREDVQPTALNGRFEYQVPPRLLGIQGVHLLGLEVVEVGDLGPRMKQIRLAGTGLEDFEYRAGQDVMLVLGGTLERPLSRRYTIRGFDGRRKLLELNVVTHGVTGPGAAWTAGTRPGDRVNGVGPRGKIFLDPAADWHLFLGDESAAPATLAMLEALPAATPGVAYIETAMAEDRFACDSTHEINWLARGDQPAWTSSLLVEAMQSAELPAGRGHVYFAGEVQVVAAIQRAAVARGLTLDQLSPKAYWGRAKANANNGEPERDP